jgi:hypothetical protein
VTGAHRPWGPLAAVCGAVALSAAWVEHHAAERIAARAEDLPRIEALVAAEGSLRTSVLEAAAGILPHFDPIVSASGSLRDAARVAAIVRSRGSGRYAASADALTAMDQAARAEELPVETLKSDLSLLRASSRYFPIAVAELARQDPATAKAVEAVRSDVERFQTTPTRELGARLEGDLAALVAGGAALGEGSRVDLAAVAGHARAILERRERVDRLVREVTRSPALADGVAARESYEAAAEREIALAATLRVLVVVFALACAGAAALAVRARRADGALT